MTNHTHSSNKSNQIQATVLGETLTLEMSLLGNVHDVPTSSLPPVLVLALSWEKEKVTSIWVCMILIIPYHWNPSLSLSVICQERGYINVCSLPVKKDPDLAQQEASHFLVIITASESETFSSVRAMPQEVHCAQCLSHNNKGDVDMLSTPKFEHEGGLILFKNTLRKFCLILWCKTQLKEIYNNISINKTSVMIHTLSCQLGKVDNRMHLDP